MNITLVEDGQLTRQRLVKLIQQCMPSAQLTELSDLASAKAHALEHKQDCWLVDLGLPDGSGIDLISLVRSVDANTNILVITMYENVERIVDSFRAGASGYLLKSSADIDLLGALQAIESGGTPLSPTIAKRLLEKALQASNTPLTADKKKGLSEREYELLNHFSQGFTYEETAQRMSLSLSTVQTMVRRIYTKLAVTSRAEAIFEARALGYL